MHPYRDAPAEGEPEVTADDTAIAILVLAVVGMIEMFAEPLTAGGVLGAACCIASVVWLVRHR